MLSVLLEILLEILSSLVAISALCLFNKKFNYKDKLINLMVTVDAYRAILVFIVIIYKFVTGKNFSTSHFSLTMLVCLFYLVKTPKNHR